MNATEETIGSCDDPTDTGDEEEELEMRAMPLHFTTLAHQFEGLRIDNRMFITRAMLLNWTFCHPCRCCDHFHLSF